MRIEKEAKKVITVVCVSAAGCVLLDYVSLLLGWESIHGVIRHLAGLECHGIPSRCFWIMGTPTAFCVRCSGGFVGLGFASIFLRKVPSKVTGRLLSGLAGLSLVYLDLLRIRSRLGPDLTAVRTVIGVIGGMGLYLVIDSVSALLFQFIGNRSRQRKNRNK